MTSRLQRSVSVSFLLVVTSSDPEKSDKTLYEALYHFQNLLRTINTEIYPQRSVKIGISRVKACEWEINLSLKTETFLEWVLSFVPQKSIQRLASDVLRKAVKETELPQ